MPPPKRPEPPIAVTAGPPARTTRFDTGTGSAVVIGGPAILCGWSFFNESTTAEAEVDLYDGLDAEVSPTFPVTLLPQESSREWFGDSGVQLLNGLFAAAVIGGVRGSVFWKPAAG